MGDESSGIARGIDADRRVIDRFSIPSAGRCKKARAGIVRVVYSDGAI